MNNNDTASGPCLYAANDYEADALAEQLLAAETPARGPTWRETVADVVEAAVCRLWSWGIGLAIRIQGAR